jgi:hypothetical protein
LFTAALVIDWVACVQPWCGVKPAMSPAAVAAMTVPTPPARRARLRLNG